MRIHLIPAWAAMAALAAPVTVMAQVSAAREQTFRERDKNHDGVLTLEEYGGHPGNFSALDANGDRVLSRDEFVNRHRDVNEAVPPAAPGTVTSTGPFEPADTFAAIDINRDNVITRAEWRADMAPASFSRLDRDHDGVVSRDEFANPLPVGSAEARFGDLDRNNDGILTRGEWVGESHAFDLVDRNRDNRITIDEYVNPSTGILNPVGSLDPRFARLDRNRDNVITRSEWRADGAPATFYRMDRNHDGVVTRDEFADPLPVGSVEARFDDLDRNNNGVLSRGEWRSENLSFELVDRNRDNRITLDEYSSQAAGGYPESDALGTRFTQLDRNRDGVLSRYEWWGDRATFRRVDRNGDGTVTRAEYMNAPVTYDAAPERTPRSDRFVTLDRDRSGYISRSEWSYDRAQFDALDRDRDGRITEYEYMNTQALTDRFRQLDRDGDGVLSRREWAGTTQTFAEFDQNRDGSVSLDEYLTY
jgi:Ca2+-binding EF-hand superfamily protein